MTRWENYMNAAEEIVAAYDGSLPLHHFLKNFFKARPHMGSRDRRRVQQLVYQYYRLGKWQPQLDVRERMLLGTFLCETSPDALLGFFKPEWNERITGTVIDKLVFLNLRWDAASAFPFVSHLSEGIDPEAFTLSYLQQPRLFIRARPGKKAAILRLLEDAGVAHETTGDAIALANGIKIEELLPDKRAYEVQDLSSQETGHRFRPQPKERWWDCCAASGGKSILLHDQQPSIGLTVSDVRASILENLHKRFAEAGIKQYDARVLDLTKPVTGFRPFKGIILDAPCSGSGTWGRSPEHLFYFTEDRITEYAALQKKIAKHVTPLLEPGGRLVYITCSVFKEENEDAVTFLQNECGLEIEESGVIKGYDREADTMFVAVGRNLT
ncbi:RsmB/NOP family class I SAM-dependent RNA methyltransferase [Chitinophaga sp. GCM10012297]|uniref:RsmB/NOP family class I SAM-dependent RNA methyltransferase n=1 Tax=Chitinophaga chungangae TaxID=2821488 RepID=A0ABS3YJS7_9BACT|nr:RsmB/NOP family class I SAM-dependent RNA methyltransferase [Chitinophaga chungangae]MBO9154933.1 RsmB/NOP family class I SAM-dependent RNA methyltransferase [Chitinophaga chungangae]